MSGPPRVEADGYCGTCRKLVPLEWRSAAWEEPGAVQVVRQRVLVTHFTASTTGAYAVRCRESGKLPWPVPERPWMTVSEEQYAAGGDVPAEEIPWQAGSLGMSANMHYVPSQREDVELGPLGEYGCLDAPFED